MEEFQLLIVPQIQRHHSRAEPAQKDGVDGRQRTQGTSRHARPPKNKRVIATRTLQDIGKRFIFGLRISIMVHHGGGAELTDFDGLNLKAAWR